MDNTFPAGLTEGGSLQLQAIREAKSATLLMLVSNGIHHPQIYYKRVYGSINHQNMGAYYYCFTNTIGNLGSKWAKPLG